MITKLGGVHEFGDVHSRLRLSTASCTRTSTTARERSVVPMDSVLTVASAAAAGVSRHAIAHQVSRGRWLRLLPGVYLTHGGTPTPVERAAAALLFAGEGAVLSGSHALQRYAVRSAPLSVAKILVLTPMSNARRSAGFVFVRRTHLAPAQPVRIGRLAVAPITRAVIDACLGLRSQRTVRAIVAEVVQRRRCSAADLAAELAVSGRRGSAFCRAAILEVGAGAWSAPECEVGELFRRAHLPGFEQNIDVCDEAGDWLACGD
ncbi:MAG: hypothetical protein M3500_14000, partial [Actinomycetota bacterium]|nr:hypothetical protein [Actinomycetota bacterium]